MAPVDESAKEDGRKGNGWALKKYWAEKEGKAKKKAEALNKYWAGRERVPPQPYVPTGKPPGRPKGSKPPRVPSGKPRGRPKKEAAE